MSAFFKGLGDGFAYLLGLKKDRDHKSFGSAVKDSTNTKPYTESLKKELSLDNLRKTSIPDIVKPCPADWLETSWNVN